MSAAANIRSVAAALRIAAEEDRRRAADRETMAARLDDVAAALDAGPAWVPLSEVAERLGLSYSAAQKRVVRCGVGKLFDGRICAPRAWLDEQVDARPRSSMSDRSDNPQDG